MIDVMGDGRLCCGAVQYLWWLWWCVDWTIPNSCLRLWYWYRYLLYQSLMRYKHLKTTLPRPDGFHFPIVSAVKFVSLSLTQRVCTEYPTRPLCL